MSDINTLNEQMVSARGDKIIVMRPLREMSSDQALVLAAYLVSMVGDDARWEETLKAVQNT